MAVLFELIAGPPPGREPDAAPVVEREIAEAPA
jgi:hypothetical protein